ncbi:hypothetical protein L6452_16531 [Arctium lappa]|uniref:Uncharacterized protein n=1 Tax=Arctium lappa TaxID=4217 RepID=A0ACB9C0T1_ARCLA|nr:hypothetical protein L6452_16531 [Arctium lappa]
MWECILLECAKELNMKHNILPNSLAKDKSTVTLRVKELQIQSLSFYLCSTIKTLDMFMNLYYNILSENSFY